MKKLFSFLSAGVLAASAVPSLAYAESTDIQSEIFAQIEANPDFNSDGAVNILDSQSMLDYYADYTAHPEKYSDEEKAAVCEKFDYTGDGVVDARDVSQLFVYLKEVILPAYDFTGDNVTNYRDAFLLSEYYAAEESSDFTSISANPDYSESAKEKIIAYGDINADGEIDARDSSLILRSLETLICNGDVNCDGALDSRDASMILSFYANSSEKETALYTANEYACLCKGDYNADGKIDSRDSSAILRAYADNATE